MIYLLMSELFNIACYYVTTQVISGLQPPTVTVIVLVFMLITAVSDLCTVVLASYGI